MVKQLGVFPRAIMIPGHDYYGSPTAYKDFLYVPTVNGVAEDGRTVPAPDAPSLICVRKDTGKVVWTDHSPGKGILLGHYASPLVIEIAGRVQVIHPQGDGWVRSFEAETGKLIWKFDVNRKSASRPIAWGGDRVYVVATPVYAGGRVYIPTGVEPEACWGAGRLFCIDPTKRGDVSPELDDGPGKGKPNPNSAVVWEFEKDGPGKEDRMHLSTGSVAVSNGFVIAVDCGWVHCLDEKTGKRYWTHFWRDISRIYGNALVVDGKVYVSDESGIVNVLELAKTKKLIAKIECVESIRTPPVYANGTLYILSESYLYAIGAKP